jgi:hypothetical protein
LRLAQSTVLAIGASFRNLSGRFAYRAEREDNIITSIPVRGGRLKGVSL